MLRGAATRRAALVTAWAWGLATLVASPAPPGAAGEARPVAPAAPALAQWFDERSFAVALARAGARPAEPMTDPRVVVVPHYWPAGHMIAAALRDLAATPPSSRAGIAANLAAAADTPGWRRVVLLGPDHPRAGPRVAYTASADWATPYGRVAADRQAVAALRATGLLVDAPRLMALEHGVAGLLPALARLLPGAAVVPLAVRSDARQTEVARLAAAVGALLEPTTVVVVSADFAHDVTPRQARINDARSLRALRSLDTGTVLGFGDAHVDAPAALAVGMTVARGSGATRFVLLERGDGSHLPGYSGGPVTSTISGYYGRPGD